VWPIPPTTFPRSLPWLGFLFLYAISGKLSCCFGAFASNARLAEVLLARGWFVSSFWCIAAKRDRPESPLFSPQFRPPFFIAFFLGLYVYFLCNGAITSFLSGV